MRGLYTSYDDLFVPMFGEYAARNARRPSRPLEALLGQALSIGAVREGLAGLTSPGRLEVIRRQPLVILDGAHNPAGAEALAVAMREFFTWDRLHLVLAVSANKDLDGMIRPLAPLADVAYAARNGSDRSGEAEVIAERFGAEDKPVELFDSVAEALAAATAAADPGDCVLVTGSLYTVADARRALV